MSLFCKPFGFTCHEPLYSRMWGLALIASLKSNLILWEFCLISFKMFPRKPDTRWRALRLEKSPLTDVSPPDLHLLSTCVFIYTRSERFLHEVTVWLLVFSECRSGFVSAPGVFAHAGSAVTESYYDFSANAAHGCSSVTILSCFHCMCCRLSRWLTCDSVQRFLLFGCIY